MNPSDHPSGGTVGPHGENDRNPAGTLTETPESGLFGTLKNTLGIRDGLVVAGVIMIVAVTLNAGPLALFLFPEAVVQPVTLAERDLYAGLGADELAASPAGWSQSFEYRRDPFGQNWVTDTNQAVLYGGDSDDYAAAVLAYLWGQGESATIVYYISPENLDAQMAIADGNGRHYSNGAVGYYRPTWYAEQYGYELVFTRTVEPPTSDSTRGGESDES